MIPKQILFFSTFLMVAVHCSSNLRNHSNSNRKRLETKKAMIRFASQWRKMFDMSHLQPNLENDFDSLFGSCNLISEKATGPNLSDVPIGTQIAMKQGNLAPLQSFSLFRGFDNSLIKTNTYRAQLLG